MTEADILALTYGDKCWVYRPQKTTLPSGESVFQKVDLPFRPSP